MVIDNFYPVRIGACPTETDAPLIIYADAVLASAAALQRFQSVPGRHSHLPQLGGRV